MSKNLLTSTAALVLAVSLSFADTAHAESCSELNQFEIDNNSAKADLLAEYPGTATALFACSAVAQSSPPDERATTMVVCAGLTCMVVGIGTCYDLAVKVTAITSREEWIERQKRSSDCLN